MFPCLKLLPPLWSPCILLPMDVKRTHSLRLLYVHASSEIRAHDPRVCTAQYRGSVCFIHHTAIVIGYLCFLVITKEILSVSLNFHLVNDHN
jgi:hypothetical protein